MEEEWSDGYKPGEKFKLYDQRLSREELVAQAKETPRVRVVTPEKDELLIDIDTKDQYDQFWTVFGRMRYNDVGLEITYNKLSRSGDPKRHIIVKMPIEMDETTRIAFQSVLGSDPMREMLSLLRIQNGDKEPTLFLEYDEEVNKDETSTSDSIIY